ncbi:DNA/RNA non-specific endonuclease [Levilactobacillus enshiensis]|uniref:DNA/RNA non-specific endonuclease n=1 Tax=Levilactobacillus enshiensis TaxID=2590213 RepID=UPI00117B994D|nr:DNA/RNA non-specific endonuclease [Levilactobacillus enshiensis]
MKKITVLTLALFSTFAIGVSGCAPTKSSAQATTSTKVVYDHSPEKKAAKLEQANAAEKERLSSQKEDISQQQVSYDHQRAATKSRAKKTAKKGPTTTPATTNLATLTYKGQQEITIDHNNPHFSRAQLSTKRGPWQTYHNLDGYNRVTGAAALLNRALMSSAKREALTVDPTGWHNKRTHHGWLYNRSHLIGYQFTGQNNNPKNLMTGTRTLNNPSMLHNEMDVAAYLKASSRHYVRYTVTPVFKGHELVARGVQMRAQSVGSNAIRFNVYIFNIEPGYTIDYATGYSQAG